MYNEVIKYDPYYYQIHINKGNKDFYAKEYSLINLQRYDEADISFT